MRRTMIKWVRRERRKAHVRKHVFGTSERPRLAVHKSLAHIYAQLIDDLTGRTLVCTSTVSPDVRPALKATGNKNAATAVGAKLAALALEKGIKKVCFDRSSFKYHGRVKALAEAARKGGLQF